MKRFILILLALALASSLGAQTAASSSQAPAPAARSAAPAARKPNGASAPAFRAPTTIVKNVNEVNVIFSAVDKHHRIVEGLRQNQVEVFDANHRQRITRFSTEGNMPLRIALLIDTSASVADRFKFEQEAAIEFIESVLRQGKDQAMVVAFDTSVQVYQPFTDDEESLAKAINSLRAGGGTAFNDAIYDTARDSLLRDGPDVRNVMVIISDGADDASQYSLSEALAEAQRAGAVIYAISTDQTNSDQTSDDLMRNLARETGGRSFFPFEAPELGHVFAQITDELRHQYVLSYDPDDFQPNGAFHPIAIKILVKNVQARARRGYYAYLNQ